METCRKSLIIIFILVLNLLQFNFSHLSAQPKIKMGADILFQDSLKLVLNKNISVITNHTALLNNGIHLVDSLNNIKSVKIINVFSPEHGFKGEAGAGEKVDYNC